MTRITNPAVWVALSAFALLPPVRAQLVSVRCFTEQTDLGRIGDCVSGDGNLVQPPTCPDGATCVLSFGIDVQLMPALCDPEDPDIPDPSRAYLSSWADPTATVWQVCVAKPQPAISLFTVYDDDGDGDLDASDVALFEKVYDVVPKIVQSEAVLGSLECCLPEEVIRNMGRCLSGPGVTTTPLPCDGLAACVAGFSEPLEVGDYQHKLCRGSAGLPDPAMSYCLLWQTVGVPVVFTCPASPMIGNTQFIVSDADGDIDVDLADFAVYQREFGAATND